MDMKKALIVVLAASIPAGCQSIGRGEPEIAVAEMPATSVSRDVASPAEGTSVSRGVARPAESTPWPAVLDRVVDPELERFIWSALAENPEIAVAKAKVDAKKAEHQAARASRLPSLAVSSSASFGEPQVTVSVTQPLWTFGRIDSEIDIAHGQAGLAKTQLVEERQRLSLAVIDAWAETARNQALTRVYTEEVAQLGQFRAMMTRRVRQNVSSDSELSLVEARVLTSQADLARAKQLVEIGRNRLATLSGARLAESKVFGEDGRSLPSVSEAEMRGIEQYIAHASDSWPGVRSSRKQVAITEAQTRLAKSRRGFELFGRYEHALSVSEKLDHKGVAYIGFTYTPGPGWSAGDRVAAARSNVEAATAALDSQRRDLSNEVLQTLETFRLESRRQAALRANAVQMGTLLKSYERQFKAGQKSWLEILNTVREVTQAKLAYRTARIDAVASWYRLRTYLTFARHASDE